MRQRNSAKRAKSAKSKAPANQSGFAAGDFRSRTGASNHRAVRQAHAEERAQDYCEVVAELLQERGCARVTAIAERLGVSHVTAIKVVKRLGREGLLEVAPYKGIGLSTAGRRVAKKAALRHDLVYRFLRAIGVSHRGASRDAEGIEHHVGAETLKVFANFVINHK